MITKAQMFKKSKKSHPPVEPLPLKVSSSSLFPNTTPRSWMAQVWNCTLNITSLVEFLYLLW